LADGCVSNALSLVVRVGHAAAMLHTLKKYKEECDKKNDAEDTNENFCNKKVLDSNLASVQIKYSKENKGLSQFA
jgi:hypothetical protein